MLNQTVSSKNIGLLIEMHCQVIFIIHFSSPKVEAKADGGYVSSFAKSCHLTADPWFA